VKCGLWRFCLEIWWNGFLEVENFDSNTVNNYNRWKYILWDLFILYINRFLKEWRLLFVLLCRVRLDNGAMKVLLSWMICCVADLINIIRVESEASWLVVEYFHSVNYIAAEVRIDLLIRMTFVDHWFITWCVRA